MSLSPSLAHYVSLLRLISNQDLILISGVMPDKVGGSYCEQFKAGF